MGHRRTPGRRRTPGHRRTPARRTPGPARALQALGYDPGGIDGIIGSGTRAALRNWQIANGETPDGYLSAGLADRLIALAQ